MLFWLRLLLQKQNLIQGLVGRYFIGKVITGSESEWETRREGKTKTGPWSCQNVSWSIYRPLLTPQILNPVGWDFPYKCWLPCTLRLLGAQEEARQRARAVQWALEVRLVSTKPVTAHWELAGMRGGARDVRQGMRSIYCMCHDRDVHRSPQVAEKGT